MSPVGPDLKTARSLALALLTASSLALATASLLLQPPPASPSIPSAAPLQIPLPARVALPIGDVWARPGLERLTDELAAYQLAGTFLGSPEPGGTTEIAIALVDHRDGGRQVLLRPGDTLGPFRVADIGLDTVTLERDGRTWTLGLTGGIAPRTASRGTENRAGAPSPASWEDMPALETSSFGKRVADNQWVIQRHAMLAYADDILKNPARAVALYQSFEQVLDSEGVGEGYRVAPQGERELFTAMGLGENDVIRKVNSMHMKNQTRAEYLVGEFMKSRMSAVVLDIERDGREEKLIYIIR